MLTAILTFLPAAAVIVVAPGPDTLLVLRNSARGGRSAGLVTAAGTVTGLLVWAFAAALGLAALVRASELGYTIVRVCGAAYLLVLGTQLIWRSRRGRTKDQDQEEEHLEPAAGRRRALSGFLTGVGTNLLNPKVGVFFISFLPVFIPQDAPVALTSLVLCAIFVTEAILWLVGVALLGHRLGAIVNRRSIRRRAERLTGLVMVGFGVRLAIEQR